MSSNPEHGGFALVCMCVPSFSKHRYFYIKKTIWTEFNVKCKWNALTSHIFCFLVQRKLPQPSTLSHIFLTAPPHHTQTNLLFFLSVVSAGGAFFSSSRQKKKKKKKVEKKQINAGLSSETLLGLAGHHLSSVFHNHSASLEPSMGFFNCPSAGERV